jgi:RHS repeat-associated protein
VVTPQVNTTSGFAYTPSVRLAEGVHTLTAQVYDQAGNQAQSGPWSFTVFDNSAPSLGVTKYYYHGSQRIAMRQDDVVYFIHSDHLGSTSLTTDITGTVVAETRYLPYGEERWITGTLVTDFTFTGQRAEAGFRLMDYNARYYDPGLGRFVSADTVVPEYANPQSLNRYAYTFGNPLKYRDPSGHAECVDAECQLRVHPVNGKLMGLNTEVRRDFILDTAKYLQKQTQGPNGITDLEAMAQLADSASILYSGNDSNARAQFVDDIGSVLTGLGGFWPEVDELLGNYNPRYTQFDPPFGQTGFAPVFQDPGKGGNQPHHFWFYVQIGYQRTWLDSDLTNLAHETIFVRPGNSTGRSFQDFALGHTGSRLGAEIRWGNVNIDQTGDWIRANLQTGSWNESKFEFLYGMFQLAVGTPAPGF